MRVQFLGLCLVFSILAACSSVSDTEIKKHIIGTWACYNGDITQSGTTFFRDGNMSSYFVGDKNNKTQVESIRHYEKGNYLIVRDVIVTKITYYALPKNKRTGTRKKSAVLKYVVDAIDKHALRMHRTTKSNTTLKITCNKVYEPRIGMYFKDFMAGKDISPSTLKAPKDAYISKLVQQRQNLTENINTIKETLYHRRVQGDLLETIGKASTKNALVTGIIGQHLNYEVSGITIDKDAVEELTRKLKKSPFFNNVSVLENLSFNIIAKNNSLNKNQKLYEFRISLIVSSPSGLVYRPEAPGETPKTRRSQEAASRRSRDKFNSVSKVLVQSGNIENALLTLAKIKDKSGIRFVKFKPEPQSEITKNHKITIIPVSIEIRGSYQQVTHFLKALSKHPQLLALYGIQLEHSSSKSSKELSLNAQLNIYKTSSKPDIVLNNYAARFPTVLSTGLKYSASTQSPDPFSTASLDYAAYRSRNIPCRTAQVVNDLYKLRFIGTVKNKNIAHAIIKLPNQAERQFAPGSCVARSTKLVQIFGSKIILKEAIQANDGSFSTRTVVLRTQTSR